MIHTVCPECGTKYDVPESAVGKKTTCKACDQRFEIRPARPPAATPVAPAPDATPFAPPSPPPPDHRARTSDTGTRHYPGLIWVEGDGEFDADVVGESHYQHALEAICGGRTPRSQEVKTRAVLILEDDNRHDPLAVRVDIKGLTVGYLSRDDARRYRDRIATAGHPRGTLGCLAMIRGGWDDGRGSRGHFGVKLDLPPFYGKGCRSEWDAALPAAGRSQPAKAYTVTASPGVDLKGEWGGLRLFVKRLILWPTFFGFVFCCILPSIVTTALSPPPRQPDGGQVDATPRRPNVTLPVAAAAPVTKTNADLSPGDIAVVDALGGRMTGATTNHESLDEYLRRARINDTEGVGALYLAGKLYEVQEGSKVRVTKIWIIDLLHGNGEPHRTVECGLGFKAWRWGASG